MNSNGKQVGIVSAKRAEAFLPHLTSGSLKMVGTVKYPGQHYTAVYVDFTIKTSDKALKLHLKQEVRFTGDSDSDDSKGN